MYRNHLLVALAMALVIPIPARSETVLHTFQQLGLLGAWANDCNQPPSKANYHSTYKALANGSVERTYYDAPGHVYNRYVLEQVTRVSSDQISYRQKGSAGFITVILKIQQNRFHVLSSTNDNGTIYVQDGKFTANTESVGKESPWQTKCHD